MGFLRLLTTCAVLLGKLVVLLPQGLYLRSHGVKAFEEQLRLLELEPEVIQALSRTYKELGKIHTWHKRY
ncbi:MAG: hypothetical protein GX197_06175 [Firmicutes bacterium]|nr:hypothetical protein [Bacillota bacterium]